MQVNRHIDCTVTQVPIEVKSRLAPSNPLFVSTPSGCAGGVAGAGVEHGRKPEYLASPARRSEWLIDA